MSTFRSNLSFSGGELAPPLYARVDVQKYQAGLRTLRNFIVQRHGGAANRPGTTFITEVKDSSKQVRQIPFKFNNEQTYNLEFGDEYIRFIRNGAQITVSGVAAWADATVYALAALVVHGGVNYYCIVAHTSTEATDEPGLGSSWEDKWYALEDDIYEIPTPYQDTDLAALQYSQSADIVTIVHPSYPVYELRRTGHTSWTLVLVTFAPGIAAPANPAVSGTGGTAAEWVVTAIAEETYEESLQSSTVGANAVPTDAAPRTVSWDAVSGAVEYNVYRRRTEGGSFGFVGTASGTSFVDNGISPDISDTPPVSRNPFDTTNNYPSAIGRYQQRLLLAGPNSDTEKVFGSRSANYKNYTISSPVQEDDAVTFSLAGNEVNAVKHMLDLGTLIILTAGGEWDIQGGDSGIIRPGEVNPKQQSYYGANSLRPLIIGGTALYVQALGSLIRDLGFDFQSDGYRGDDLTIFSAHLFEGHTIVSWAYQQVPHSIVWAVRDDGVLLGLTYVREHQMFAWHRHDTDGTVEDVNVIPEGNEHVLYLVVKRTIDGQTKRYIEKLNSRFIDDPKDMKFMDCCLTYDGRNTNGSHSMTLSGGTDWTHTEQLTLTSSTAFFAVGDIGNEIHLTGADGTLLRCEIIDYTSNLIVTVRSHKTVPVGMRSAAISDWAKAIDELSGLDHLEGENVSVLGDGFVVASPNNSAYQVITVDSGDITLDRPYSVIHVGLPYTSDIETLDIDSVNNETLMDKKTLITNLTLYVEKSRGIWVGPKPPEDEDMLEDLAEIKPREFEGYDDPPALKTEPLPVNMKSHWSKGGRIFVRQIDPIPLTVLAIAPAGLIPVRG